MTKLTPEQHKQVEHLYPGVFTARQLRQARLDHGLTWVLPTDLLPGGTQLFGIPVIHADVPKPLLAVDPVGPAPSGQCNHPRLVPRDPCAECDPRDPLKARFG